MVACGPQAASRQEQSWRIETLVGCRSSNQSTINMRLARAKMYFSYHIYIGLLFASSFSRSSAWVGNFSMGSDSNPYNCSANLVCRGDAHIGDPDRKYPGMLSLVNESGQLSTNRSGLAYYNHPVRMLHSRQSASFNTSFVFAQVAEQLGENGTIVGDGMAFVISGDSRHAAGYPGATFGFFQQDGTNSHKSIVVEFDNIGNPEAPIYDIGANHVSIDIQNITAVAVRNASDVNIELWDAGPTYAWVEYSSDTQLLEVRISRTNSRPLQSLVNYTVDLYDVVSEFMWVGFSGGNAGTYSHYYIGEWSFESRGIEGASSSGIPAPAPSSGIPAPAPSSRIPAPAPPSAIPAPAPPKARSKVGMIVGIAVCVPTVTTLIIAGVIFLYFVRRRSTRSATGPLTMGLVPKSHSDSENPMLQLAGMAEGYRFSYTQLSVATGGFSEEAKLGQGGAGSVYRGVLPTSGTPVAVKKISGESKNGEKLFLDEVLSISQLRHRNLILLLGWCRERDKYLIVYELMPNGSLDKVLFGLDERHTPLSWPQRLNILRGTAAALEYLQQGWKQQVIHRDIKSSNIMLDAEWNAKLGDFGLARLVDHERTPATTLVAGTCGYIAPEAAATGKFTDKTDVFSFGAVALEIACGRRSVSLHMPPDEMILVDWVWERFSEGDLLSVVDRRLDDYDTHWMEVVLRMGLLCSHPNPQDRPTMRHIVQVLAGDAPVPSVPASKPAPTFVSGTPSKSVSHSSRRWSSARSISKSLSWSQQSPR